MKIFGKTEDGISVSRKVLALTRFDIYSSSYITRPNCALDRRTILFLYVPGFQKQVLTYVSKCKWIPQTKFQWIPHTYTCNLNFVGTFIL